MFQSSRNPADRIRLNNLELVKGELLDLPDAFFGTVELHFHRGALLHMKTITSKKFNPEANTPEASGEHFHSPANR
jgi:hypothetical protein